MPSVSRRYASSRARFARPGGPAGEEQAAPVVLMVSGGADSTALLVLAATSSLDIDDGRSVARIARALGIPAAVDADAQVIRFYES